jgi:hypothetical protein
LTAGRPIGYNQRVDRPRSTRAGGNTPFRRFEVSKHAQAAAITVAALGLLTGGCDSKPTGGTVTGTVTLDGVPLKLGVVTFHPVAGGQSAIGPVSKDATYELTIGNERFIPPGEYLVTVDAAEPTELQGVPGGPPTPPPPPKRITPNKYAKKESTDLKVTVKAGTNTIPIELKSGQ